MNWDSPYIITSVVNFFSIYFKKCGHIRKMHKLHDSVLIFDEVQAIPYKFMSEFYEIVRFLSNICNCTILLCTATQPNYKKSNLFVDDEIGGDMQYINRIFTDSKRVKFIWDCDESISKNQLSLLIVNAGREKSVLCVLNTVADAQDVFNMTKTTTDTPVFCLSSKMCKVHRNSILTKDKK